MTLSSSASHGLPKGDGSPSAMLKGGNHRMSDSSSEGGAGRKLTGLQQTLKGFAEPSEDSRSVDEKEPMFSSSEEASMTNKGKTGSQGRQTPWPAGSSTGCIAGA